MLLITVFQPHELNELNKPLPREVISVVVLPWGNELYELYEPNKPWTMDHGPCGFEKEG